MDNIKTALTTLLKETPSFFERMSSFPNTCSKLSDEELSIYKGTNDKQRKKVIKGLVTSDENITKVLYVIIKKLIQAQGVNSIHPAWFFFLQEHFKKDNFIFEIDDNDNLNFNVPKDFKMPHRIQIITTLKIYYSLLTNTKIRECFIHIESRFTEKYPEFKELWKYLFFPIIEENNNNKFIDLSYNFDNIISSIKLEINEPHHDEDIDKMREQLIYFKTQNRIIHCYLSKEVKKKKKNEPITDVIERINNCINEIMPQVINNYFFRLTFNLYNINNYAGLTFDAFSRNIIPNLSTSLFFTKLTELSTPNPEKQPPDNLPKLTWKMFRELCKEEGIIIPGNFIKEIEKETKNCDEETKKKIYNNKFYLTAQEKNTLKLNNNTLLTENGVDYFLMKLTEEHCDDSVLIKDIYSNYKIEYTKLMSAFLDEKNYENDMLMKQSDYDKETRDARIKELENVIEIISKGLKILKK